MQHPNPALREIPQPVRCADAERQQLFIAEIGPSAHGDAGAGQRLFHPHVATKYFLVERGDAERLGYLSDSTPHHPKNGTLEGGTARNSRQTSYSHRLIPATTVGQIEDHSESAPPEIETFRCPRPLIRGACCIHGVPRYDLSSIPV